MTRERKEKSFEPSCLFVLLVPRRIRGVGFVEDTVRGEGCWMGQGKKERERKEKGWQCGGTRTTSRMGFPDCGMGVLMIPHLPSLDFPIYLPRRINEKKTSPSSILWIHLLNIPVYVSHSQENVFLSFFLFLLPWIIS